jgi:hypothetical protein
MSDWSDEQTDEIGLYRRSTEKRLSPGRQWLGLFIAMASVLTYLFEVVGRHGHYVLFDIAGASVRD